MGLGRHSATGIDGLRGDVADSVCRVRSRDVGRAAGGLPFTPAQNEKNCRTWDPMAGLIGHGRQSARQAKLRPLCPSPSDALFGLLTRHWQFFCPLFGLSVPYLFRGARSRPVLVFG